MEPEELLSWITSRLEKSRKHLSTAVRNSLSVQNALVKHTGFLDINPRKPVTFSQRCYHVYYKIDIIPLCSCGKELGFDKQVWSYSSICSRSCYVKNSIQETLKESVIRNYGVDNFSKTKEFKQMMVAHNISTYGVEHYQSTEEFKAKSAVTCLSKYGVDHYSKSPEFKFKSQRSLLDRYGVSSYSKTSEFKVKMREVCAERYPGGLPFGNSYAYKEYTTPAGSKIDVQGYENHALDELYAQYPVWEVIAGTHIVTNRLGIIMYEYLGDSHRYYPDIFLPKLNVVIEVKSCYYYYKDYEKNMAKKDAIINMGYDFEFWVITSKRGAITIQKHSFLRTNPV